MDCGNCVAMRRTRLSAASGEAMRAILLASATADHFGGSVRQPSGLAKLAPVCRGGRARGGEQCSHPGHRTFAILAMRPRLFSCPHPERESSQAVLVKIVKHPSGLAGGIYFWLSGLLQRDLGNCGCEVYDRPKIVPILAVVPGAVHLLTTIQGRRNRLSCNRQTGEFSSERLGASWKMDHNALRLYTLACGCQGRHSGIMRRR